MAPRRLSGVTPGREEIHMRDHTCEIAGQRAHRHFRCRDMVATQGKEGGLALSDRRGVGL